MTTIHMAVRGAAATTTLRPNITHTVRPFLGTVSVESRRLPHGGDWMDREYAFRVSLGVAGERVSSGKRLLQLRRRLNQPGLSREGRVRPRRKVVLYARTFHGEDVAPIFDRLKEEADRQGWHAERVIHDQAPLGHGAHAVPEHWPGWRSVRHLISAGLADGVLVPDRSHISSNDAAYTSELEFVAECLGFTALLVPEAEP
ncbi:hypothetical protein [Streptomyces sp. NPDC056632]|uniref:hypothetical protein n=1 Tax=Streptomyces sp. NPDC056632 TaxID=3345884 RepID=UPI003695CF8C